jgi:hypothetical protein
MPACDASIARVPVGAISTQNYRTSVQATSILASVEPPLAALNTRLGVLVMRKSNTKKKHEQREFNGRARKLQRQTATRSTSAPKKVSASRKHLRTIEAIRAHAADLLKNCKAKPFDLYDAGFQAALEEIGRLLDPEGYSPARPMAQLIAALQKGSGVNSKARLQSFEAFRDYLVMFFAGVLRDPSDRPFLYGYEDAHWRMWRMVTRGRDDMMSEISRTVDN